jgi:xanthine dehydrogenase YagS FAD-binding subunit
MKPFSYDRPANTPDALRALTNDTARLLGGGTNLVDLMREGIETPDSLIDVAGMQLDQIVETSSGFHVGAGVTNTALAASNAIRTSLPMVAQAIVSGATGQIRNMATVGGNIMQRTRCTAFYDQAAACNKRNPGNGCDARFGHHRTTAILGTSDACIATHPSDLCVALAALDTTVHVDSTHGTRSIPFGSFHPLPGNTPHIETTLQPGELITAIDIATLPAGWVQTYRKVRDRSSYAFALVSVATAAHIAEGTVVDVRIALGGVGTRPWRAHTAEAALRGKPAIESEFRSAIQQELAHAVSLPDNAFKVLLTERVVVAVLRTLTEANASPGSTDSGPNLKVKP